MDDTLVASIVMVVETFKMVTLNSYFVVGGKPFSSRNVPNKHTHVALV